MLFQFLWFYGVVWKDVEEETRDILECTVSVLARKTEGKPRKPPSRVRFEHVTF
jgi:hypothetical protein